MSEKKSIVETETLPKPTNRNNPDRGPVLEARTVAFTFPHAENPFSKDFLLKPMRAR